MRVRTALSLSVFLATGLGAPAQADWILTPYGGLVFGGDLSIDDDDIDGDDDDDDSQSHGVYGLSLGYMSDSALGFEVDLGYSPDFFGDENTIVPENNVVTLMGNLVLNAPIGGSGRVYLSGGGGLLR